MILLLTPLLFVAGNGVKPKRGQSVTVHCVSRRTRSISDISEIHSDTPVALFLFDPDWVRETSGFECQVLVHQGPWSTAVHFSGRNGQRYIAISGYLVDRWLYPSSFLTTMIVALFVCAVIKGWDESVIDMSIGEIAKVHCSPGTLSEISILDEFALYSCSLSLLFLAFCLDYAYGAGGFPAWGIEPSSELLFEIEILKYS